MKRRTRSHMPFHRRDYRHRWPGALPLDLAWGATAPRTPIVDGRIVAVDGRVWKIGSERSE